MRCPSCRRRQRSENALRTQIASAKSNVRADPDDATAWLSLAEAIVRYHQRTGHGNLEEAIAAARRVLRLARRPSSRIEATFWEALAQVQAGRIEKARPLLEVLLAQQPRNRRERVLQNEARAWLK